MDEQLKPWLLEVNTSPSVACASPLDMDIKTAVLTDLLNVVGIAVPDPAAHSTAAGAARNTDSRLESRLSAFESERGAGERGTGEGGQGKEETDYIIKLLPNPGATAPFGLPKTLEQTRV